MNWKDETNSVENAIMGIETEFKRISPEFIARQDSESDSSVESPMYKRQSPNKNLNLTEISHSNEEELPFTTARSLKRNSVLSKTTLNFRPEEGPIPSPIGKPQHFVFGDRSLLLNNKKDLQFNLKKYGAPQGTQNRRKFSGIDEDDYFIFVEDYDKFIGEFVSNQNLKVVRGFINSNEFNRIYYTKMEPKNQQGKANVLMVHGFGHSGKYLDLGAAIAKSGYIVHLFDLRGFGFSGGKRYNPPLQEIHEDILMIMRNSMSKLLPLYIYGHGFGASIVFVLLLKNNFNIAGVILSSTMMSIQHLERGSYGKLKIFLLKYLGEFFKDFVINNIVNPTALTKNSYNIKRFLDDRICVPFVGLKFLANLLGAFDIIKSEAHKFKYPVLMIHGQKDQICDWKDAQKLYNKIKSKDKKITFFKNGFHEPFLDYEADEYKQVILDWLNTRMLPRKPTNRGPINLGNIKVGDLGVKRNSRIFKKRVLIGVLITIVYLKGLFFLRKREMYQKNKYLMYFYPIFWLYKLISLTTRTTLNNVKNFLFELLKETKLSNIAVNSTKTLS